MPTERDVVSFVPQNYAQNRQRNPTRNVILVTETNRRFSERTKLATEEFEYPRDGSEPGLLLIFNEEIFSKEEPRTGSTKDANDIIDCFQKLGFNVEENNILVNSTRSEILDKLADTASSNLSKYNCLIIFLLSHGDRSDQVSVPDGVIHAHELWEPFIKCPTLMNKPKMFVFQTCKGKEISTTDHADAGTKVVPSNIFSKTRNYIAPDVLVAYATVEGNSAYRNTVVGSWFIQELCKNFLAYGKRDDVVSLLIRTAKCVALNYFDTYNDDYVKQMPVFISALSRKFYLNTNKDRDILLKILKTSEMMLDELQQIKRILTDNRV